VVGNTDKKTHEN